jgi:uncharacterized Fe-S cluster-containing radical SAM superfamily protein|tara:strand:- start:347 stop:1561 length:1215 start_codon:yes stop_codon:yes gene_type:complete
VYDEDGKEVTLGSHSIKDIFHSEYYKNIRQEIRDGKLPDNCSPCWQDEANGNKSKREQYNEYARARYGSINYQQEPDMPADIQLTLSNTCNLKCRSCNPHNSSKWVKEARDRGLPYNEEVVDVPLLDFENSKFWTTMDEWLPSITQLEVMGGEPFYMKEFRKFVTTLVDKGVAKNIHLNTCTNGTFANKKFLKTLTDNFASVGFNVSIDGATKERFEYLRHGADWDIVSENLDYFHSLNESRQASIGISHTITAFNVMYLAEFHKVFKERWPTFIIYHNIARFPTWFNPSVFPEEMKPAIVKPLLGHNNKEFEGIAKFVLTPRKETVKPYGNLPTDTVENEIKHRWNLFRQQIVSGDLYRKENFKDAFPELWEIVKHDFLYNKEMIKAKEHPSTYGSLEKGKVI